MPEEEPDVSSPSAYFVVEHDEEKVINEAFEKMKLSGQAHPDEKYQQVFYIESTEEEKANTSSITFHKPQAQSPSKPSSYQTVKNEKPSPSKAIKT